jgi:hypothetical protein
MKDGLFLMDLMASNNWVRPIYFAITVSSETYQNLDKFFQLEGLAYRIVPIEAPRTGGRYGKVDSERMYNNLMNVYRYRSMNDPKVYIDENNSRIISNYRNIFGRLALQLADEGKNDLAVNALDKCMEVIPPQVVPFNFFALSLIEGYYKANSNEKAIEYSRIYMEQCADELRYLLGLPEKFVGNVKSDVQLNLYIVQELHRMASTYNASQHVNELEELFKVLESKISNAG